MQDIISPVIFGFKGLELSEEEISFFKESRPFGYILFKRNIDTPAQVKALNQQLRIIDDSYSPEILIDQEGGRVARLKPPHFQEFPSMEDLLKNGGDLEKIRSNFKHLGKELYDLGFTIDCAPVADLRIEGADNIIGDRSFGDDPVFVAQCAKAVILGLNDSNIEGIIKHIPGHGRALVDSHLALPRVTESLATLESTDFLAFKQLASTAKYAMTAHIIYEALDPNHPATLSKIVVDYIRNKIGFKGILMTDDLSMKALSGSMSELSMSALAAGCDLLLHCNGEMSEMLDIVKAVREFESQKS